MRDINLIVIHCAATPSDMDIGVEEIRSWHMKKGWSDIGYHHVILRDGTVEPGRPVETAGAHAKNHNANSIGVCMVGGVDEANKPQSNFTRYQWRALDTLIRQLAAEYPNAKVCGHRDLPGVTKECPSFDAVSWWHAL